jgi:hypothetical protein
MLGLNLVVLTWCFSLLLGAMRSKSTLFSKLIIGLITIDTMLGAVSYSLLISATKDYNQTNPRASKFVFGRCLMGITVITDLQRFLTWLTAFMLGWKQHIVAK